MKILDVSTVSLSAARAWAAARGGHQRFINVAAIYWDLAPLFGIPPEIPYGQAAKETAKGHYTGVVGPERHNWCGLKKATGGSNSDPDAHQTFPDDRAGVIAHLWHLYGYTGRTQGQGPDLPVNDPRFHLITDYTDTVEGLGGPKSWAPSPTYGVETAAIVQDLRNYAMAIHGAPPVPTTQPTVALAAGHHNTSGGNAVEHEQVGRLTPAIAAALRNRGVAVRVITPDEGRGNYNGSLSDVAGQVKATDDVFLEVHTEGTSNPHVRGVFAIYPDWGSDVDTDVRDTLGPALVNAISGATGLPIRGSGLMSEKVTGVGSQGHRLGVFGATEPLKVSVTRLIVEYGSHTNAADMALWAAPGFIERAAGATADAIAQFLGVPATPRQPTDDPPAPDPNAQYFPQTDKWIVNQDGAPMLTAWRNKGGLATCGYPQTGMTLDEDGVYRQVFDNVMIEIYPDGLVRFGGLGQRYVAALARITEMEAA